MASSLLTSEQTVALLKAVVMGYTHAGRAMDGRGDFDAALNKAIDAENELRDYIEHLENAVAAARDVRNRLQLSKQGSWRGDDAFPSHSHDVDGVWDASNGPPDGGKPCADCAAWKTLLAALDAPASK